MRRSVVVFACVALAVGAGESRGQGWTDDRTLTHRFDVGPATADPSRIGVHYDVRYEFHRTRPDPEGLHFGFALTATGFEDLHEDADGSSNGTVETAFVGPHYTSGQTTPLPPEHQRRYRQLLEIDRAELTPAQDRELNELIARVTENRRFVSFDTHYRYEYARGTDSEQHVLGAGASGEVPVLHKLLGVISDLTSTAPEHRQVPVRFHIGLDYVLADNVSVAQNSVGGDYPRVSAELAWSTLVLDRLVLRAHWRGDYLVDAPPAIADVGRELNSAVESWVVFPLLDHTGIMLKYTVGRFAPDYRPSDDLRAGLTIAVQ